MLNFLFGQKPGRNIPEQLYGEVVAQSRQPVFFTDFGFEDTVMGRFDVLSLHTFLLCHRLGLETESRAMALAQEVFDAYTANVDDALRELGIGDTSVPKKKKKMVRSFYGQIEDFREPLLTKDGELLRDRVADRFYGGEVHAHAADLTDYMMANIDHLAAMPLKSFYRGQMTWLDGSRFVKAA